MRFYLDFRLAFLFLIGIFSSTAYSAHEKEADFYLMYGVADYEDDFVKGLDPTGVVIRFVPATDKWIGYEGRLGLGISEGKGTGGVEVDVNSIVGLYLNAHSSIGKALSVYGVAGFTWVRYELEFGGTPSMEADDESGFTYGFGIDIGIQNNLKLNLEFMQYHDRSDFDLSVISLGVSF